MAASSTGPWAPSSFANDSASDSFTFSSMSNQPHIRKRAADEAPSDQGGAPDVKRRRPNLANGFQAMSISGAHDPSEMPPQWYSHPGAGAVQDDTEDEEGLEPTRPPLDGDVGVEILPDRSPGPSSLSSRPSSFWKRSSSFSSTSPSEDDYDSDATFRLPNQRRPPPQQPTSVEQPEVVTPTTPKHTTGPPHVDYMDSAHKRKKSNDGSSSPEMRYKRRRPSMDLDMDLPDSQRGRNWYEPEKDRIVVTSLDSPSPEPEGTPELDDMMSRSTTASPPPDRGEGSYSYEENRNLAQPGANGFTISPSLLTHILNAQRDQFGSNPNFTVEPAERGLVLYRPVGGMPPEEIVRQWQQKAKSNRVRPHIPDPDGHRFELVDDDEDLMNGPAVVGVPSDELWTPGTGNISAMDTDMSGMGGAGGGGVEPDGDVDMGG